MPRYQAAKRAMSDHTHTPSTPLPPSHNRCRGSSASAWERSFDCSTLRPLIICRGPIRKEAIDVFRSLGISHIGMLLSERDSIVFAGARAPELRHIAAQHVHPVADYSGADAAERQQRIAEIIDIAQRHNYNSVFAGYGFMAEDAQLSRQLQSAGLLFIGPSAQVSDNAGLKDRAKCTAREVDVSVTPGVDNLAELTLLAKYPDSAALLALAKQHQLDIASTTTTSASALAQQLLSAAMEQAIELYDINELCAQAQQQAQDLFTRHPGYRLRIKAVGGGGGKGQRVLAAPGSAQRAADSATAVPEAVREVLAEMKSLGPGDNRNVLLELNIENTRHVEIQVIGNGHWCIALGGRDCSVQAHEQKLIELSTTLESLAQDITTAEATQRTAEARSLRRERSMLEQMEREAVRFATAVGLDSVSTFECIVDAKRHFFMEMNTRIQVEHRVTELCYALEFCNPQDPSDSFCVDSLIEAMVLLAVHSAALPEPRRVPLAQAAVEVRLNASNNALAPHAGGVIEYWSAPVSGEIRDDQGISLPNADSGHFVRYHLSGAYDSNIALVLCEGTNRKTALQSLANILSCMELHGRDLATNLDFHRGLITWLLAHNPNARLGTGFVPPWLAAVGQLSEGASNIDLPYAWRLLSKQRITAAPPAVRDAWEHCLAAKQLLLVRALQELLERPHLLAGWLGHSHTAIQWHKGRAIAVQNPLQQLSELYHYLNKAPHPERAASAQIWDHDQQLLAEGMAFYHEVAGHLGARSAAEFSYLELSQQLSSRNAPKRISRTRWRALRAAHLGYQCGLELLHIPAALGRAVGFHRLRCRTDLSISMPAEWKDSELQAQMQRVLAPPPPQSSDEIVAQSGGTFYRREAADRPPFIEAGQHFDRGDTLCIIEVMKMFNKIRAPFAGTLEALLEENDGGIVRKGQPLFRVRPDEIAAPPIDPSTRQQQRREYTADLLQRVVLTQ